MWYLVLRSNHAWNLIQSSSFLNEGRKDEKKSKSEDIKKVFIPWRTYWQVFDFWSGKKNFMEVVLQTVHCQKMEHLRSFNVALDFEWFLIEKNGVHLAQTE